MKKIILGSIITFTLLLVCNSCSKKDTPTNNNLTDTPTAKTQYDATNFGIYKGVFVGSSGTIIVDISNSGTFTATLKIDGVTYNFTTNQTVQINQPTTLNFSNGTNSFTFSVSANGANPTITNLIINGHPNAAILVVKEISTSIIKCFEGTFTGGDSGVFNAVIFNTTIKALVRSTRANSNSIANGTITNNQISATGSVSTGATFTGTLNGNSFTGTWTNAQAALNGNFSGTRTF
jgi:hypothetical protein